jgi:hypothetical protein
MCIGGGSNFQLVGYFLAILRPKEISSIREILHLDERPFNLLRLVYTIKVSMITVGILQR